MGEPGRDPQIVVASLLGDPRLLTVCQAHDVQSLIHLLRSRGASLRGLASAVGISPGRLHEYATGERRPAGFEVFERISDGFRIPGHYLRLADRPWERPAMNPAEGSPRPALPSTSSEPWVPSHTVDAVSRFTQYDLMLDRRQATKTLAALAIGAPLMECVERWLTPDHEDAPHRPLGNVGLDEVQQIEQAAKLFREWDDHFGGGLRRKAVVGQLSEVSDLLRDHHAPDIERRLFCAMAELAKTAATMSWDSSQQVAAQQYYVLSLRAAKEAHERAFGASILASMARQILYIGEPGDALELIRLADDGAKGHATPTVRAMLHTREAWAYAKLGRIQAFRRATGKAEDALSQAKPADDPYWIRYFDEAELAGVTGGRFLELAYDDPKYAREAQVRIERAVRLRRPESRRSRALDQAGLAQAHLVQGDFEAAVSAGNKAIEISKQTQSDRVSVQLRDLYQATVPYTRVPAVREFADRLGAMLAA